MTTPPALFDDADVLAEAIAREVGTNIVLALPLGLGKANHVANALYARAVADRSVRLRIFTALTLEKPQSGSELERRFIEPAMERLFGAYPDLAYANALRERRLPSNIEPELLRQAKHAGKIPESFEIPSACRENTPERIERALAPARERGLLPPFPFGTDFTETEQRLIPVLQALKDASGSSWRLFQLALRGILTRDIPESDEDCLVRLGLSRPTGIPERFYNALLRAALRQRQGPRG